ncbi:hypothetical protein EJ06DRAFT_580031 [Trichodelitschia bisporula]|uniref:Uncharacterized protein n=1 Tax=Trichodelitschia bisporula TaxID=703511 RepID=A0A6G1I3Y5_9PEZI|nr:hypothetical protein EJ06DRAFT_580031 [Trichodelitschia bisporula]
MPSIQNGPAPTAPSIYTLAAAPSNWAPGITPSPTKQNTTLFFNHQTSTMRVSVLLAAVSMAFGSALATESIDGKPFKFGVNQGSLPTQYLTASGMGSSDISKGVTCTITAGALKCGDLGISTSVPGDMTAVKLVKGLATTGWSLNNDVITVGTGSRKYTFSLRTNQPNTAIWIENCPHGHFQPHGVAKAYFVEA